MSNLPTRRGLLFDFPNALEEIFNFDRPISALQRKSTVCSFAVDVEETPESYVIKANMPGVPKENIELHADGHDLTISVKDHSEKETNEKNYIYRERWSGSASRTLTLPLSSNTDEINAKVKDGVLEVIVRKRPEKQTRRISVN